MDLMIDLETWAPSEDAVIRAIGIVAFEADYPDNHRVRLTDCSQIVDKQIERGRVIDPDTVAWWRKQELTLSNAIAVGRTEYGGSCTTATRIADIIEDIDEMAAYSNPGNFSVWARSPSFDLRILAHLYRSINKPLPWKFWQERDCRTLDTFCPRVRSARPHDPLSDCFAQAQHVRDTAKLLGLAA